MRLFPSGFSIILLSTLFGSCSTGNEKNAPTADSLAIRQAYNESPVLEPEESLKHFQLENGFEIKLVAAEPLVVTPIAMTFDAKGRIWVVEMQSYMPDTNGIGENVPSGTISILEDTNGDRQMDKRTVFVEDLVLPRALCLIDSGVLVAEPPKLWYIENNNGKAGKRTLVDAHYAEGGNVEHQPNGLLRAMDNWIYNAKSNKRYRKEGDEWLIEKTVFRGQWGISQDNYGRLFYNNNSENLLGDYFLPRFGMGNPFLHDVAGYNENIVDNNRVYSIRPNTGVNRGYRDGVLNDSLRLVNFTAACGPVIYRGNLFGDDYSQNAFVAEPSANLVKRNILQSSVNTVTGKQAYDHKEFLASADERFRPVNLYNGPDGALYIVDMYRGIIQHKTYLTDYLKNEIKERELAPPLNCGRIYKIIPKNSSPNPVTFPNNPEGLVKLLVHPNGWVRDKAQQLIIDKQLLEAIPYLKKTLNQEETTIALIHSLWTLEGLGKLAWPDVEPLLRSKNLHITAQAITVIPSVINKNNYKEIMKSLQPLLSEKKIAPYLAYVQNALQPFAEKAVFNRLISIAKKYPNDAYVADAVISNLSGKEQAFLDKLNQRTADSTLLIKKRLKKVLYNIEQNRLAQLNKELMKKLARGKALFQQICQACHGADGNGIRALAPPLNRSEWVTGDKESLISIVLYGLHGPVEVNGKIYQSPEISGEMPGIAHNKQLSDNDIAQIISFVRNSWNNKAGLVTADDIKAVRKKFPSRKSAFTVEGLEKAWE